VTVFSFLVSLETLKLSIARLFRSRLAVRGPGSRWQLDKHGVYRPSMAGDTASCGDRRRFSREINIAYTCLRVTAKHRRGLTTTSGGDESFATVVNTFPLT